MEVRLDDDRSHVDRAALIRPDPRLPDHRVARHDLGSDRDGVRRRERKIDRQHEKIRRGTGTRREVVVAQIEVQVLTAAGASVADFIAAEIVRAVIVRAVIVLARVMHPLRGEAVLAAVVTVGDEGSNRRWPRLVPVGDEVLAAVLEGDAQRLAPAKRRQPLHEQEDHGDESGEGVGHGVERGSGSKTALGTRCAGEGIDETPSGIQEAQAPHRPAAGPQAGGDQSPDRIDGRVEVGRSPERPLGAARCQPRLR